MKNILRKEIIGGPYFIFGNDNFLKLHYANTIANKAMNKDFNDFNLHRFDGKSTSVDKIAEAVEALPMFSERTCIIVNDLPLNEMDQVEIDNLKIILNDTPKTCAFILLMDTVEKKIKKENKLKNEDNDSETETESDGETEIIEEKQKKENVWDEILSIVIEKGYAFELNNRTSSELVVELEKGAKKRGHKIEPKTARYLIESVGSDLSNLKNELDKICSFSKSEMITNAEINEIAYKSIEARVFDMAKSLLDNNYTNACTILDSLLPDTDANQKSTAIQIMGALISPFIDMYRSKVAISSGFKSANIANYYNYKDKEFRLNHSARDVVKLSINQICNCLNLLLDADYLLKSKPINPKIVLEHTMVLILNIIK